MRCVPVIGVGGGARGREAVGVCGGEEPVGEEGEEAASSSQEAGGSILGVGFEVLGLCEGVRESFCREDSRAIWAR